MTKSSLLLAALLALATLPAAADERISVISPESLRNEFFVAKPSGLAAQPLLSFVGDGVNTTSGVARATRVVQDAKGRIHLLGPAKEEKPQAVAPARN